MITTPIANFTIRETTASDIPLILKFIKDLATYEKLADEVTATEEALEAALFGPDPAAEVIIGDYNQQPVGFALFLPHFSTFLGKPGMYLEDLFVDPDMRGKGFGKVLLSYLAHLSMQRGYGRLEWSVIDWNEPAIRFYESLGAKAMDTWTVHRMTEKTMATLADEFRSE